MGAIEDTRTVLQGFLAPELRAPSVRLDAVEKKVASVEKTADRRFDEVGRRADRRHDEMMMIMRQVIDVTASQQRLAKLESQQLTHQ